MTPMCRRLFNTIVEIVRSNPRKLAKMVDTIRIIVPHKLIG